MKWMQTHFEWSISNPDKIVQSIRAGDTGELGHIDDIVKED